MLSKDIFRGVEKIPLTVVSCSCVIYNVGETVGVECSNGVTSVFCVCMSVVSYVLPSLNVNAVSVVSGMNFTLACTLSVVMVGIIFVMVVNVSVMNEEIDVSVGSVLVI